MYTYAQYRIIKHNQLSYNWELPEARCARLSSLGWCSDNNRVKTGAHGSMVITVLCWTDILTIAAGLMWLWCAIMAGTWWLDCLIVKMDTKYWWDYTLISPCGWLGSSSSKLRTMLIRAYNLRRKSPSRHSFNTFECHLVSNIVIKSYYRRVSCCQIICGNPGGHYRKLQCMILNRDIL